MCSFLFRLPENGKDSIMMNITLSLDGAVRTAKYVRRSAGLEVEFMKETKAKTYEYEYDDYEDGEKGAGTMVEEILKDPEFAELTEVVIGDWGNAWDDSCQEIIDGIVEHADRFSHIDRLFIGDMDYECCEVSWIMQGNYSKLWAAMPQLKALTIKGSTDLVLGKISHENLEELTIICGGLPEDVLMAIQEAHLPNLRKLLLYLGVDNYGFDGDADRIRTFLEKSDFPRLTYLGLTDSEIQDELVEVVLESKYIGQIRTLDLSMGSLTDKGGDLLLTRLPSYSNIEVLDVHYHYMSSEMVKKLEGLCAQHIEVNASEQEKPYTSSYDGTVYYTPMLTE